MAAPAPIPTVGPAAMRMPVARRHGPIRDMEVGDVPGNAGACAGGNRWTLAGAERDHRDQPGGAGAGAAAPGGRCRADPRPAADSAQPDGPTRLRSYGRPKMQRHPPLTGLGKLTVTGFVGLLA